MVEAFEAQAVDYLLKPVDETRLAACVQRLQRILAQRQDAVQPATNGVRISLDDRRDIARIVQESGPVRAPRQTIGGR